MNNLGEAGSFDDEPAIAEARRYVDRALGGIDTLHLGPLDYNVAQTVDYLLAAARVLEQFGKDRA
jgi:hypothetical protein